MECSAAQVPFVICKEFQRTLECGQVCGQCSVVGPETFQVSYEVKICHNDPKILAFFFFFYHSQVNHGFSNK